MENKIIQEPNELLRKCCESVDDFKKAKKIVAELLMTIKSVAKFWNRWLGLAANQIGYSTRIIVLRKGSDEYAVMINPEFIEKKFSFPYLEKCHSVRGVYLVKRFLWCKVKYQDLEGNWHEKILEGPSAIYQEIDHINGILVSEKGKRLF